MLPGSPHAASSSRNRSLVTAFRSPATAAASRRPPFQGQSSWPATSLPSQPASAPVRPFGSTTASRFAPVAAASLPQARCASTTRFGLAASSASTPLRDFYLPPDQSVQPHSLPAGPPSESARFPFAPRRRSITSVGLRIIVPGPLRFRRLAVPQTSWNLLHYAPESVYRSMLFCRAKIRFSSTFI